tara:strand:+ start:1880 stop:2149 length:270 start_codon:yes stop_codon:yes gene_type:complete
MNFPCDIFTKILEERSKIMKLEKLENKAHINFMNCMSELEELTDNLVIDIQIQVDMLENETDEEYYEELLNYSFSELLIENIINNYHLN